eukprot:GSChrysophyteH1.ASY1.ANO1.1234.1 assembled CDS
MGGGAWPFLYCYTLLRGTFVGGNNRSVMPLDVLGRTRATLTHATSFFLSERLLQLLILNEEFLVNASHQLALITSLPFVHTARRTYRLDFSVKSSDLDRDTLG